MKTGGIILCGGRSTRMGQDKATLPFGPESMLQRVVRLLGEVIELRNLVVVAASAQQLPPLPAEVIVTRDALEGRGPLQGIAAGLQALPGDVEAACITSCDVPLLVPAFVTRMFELLGNNEIAVPRENAQVHPLPAVYRRTILPQVQALLAANQLRLGALFDEVPTRFVVADELRPVDPDLRTLMNLNSTEDYRAALALAGFQAPPGVR
jgi:molybdopterin-guanine dinucleotide biosynthesis protein A